MGNLFRASHCGNYKKIEKLGKWETFTIKTLLLRLCEKGVVYANKKFRDNLGLLQNELTVNIE